MRGWQLESADSETNASSLMMSPPAPSRSRITNPIRRARHIIVTKKDRHKGDNNTYKHNKKSGAACVATVAESSEEETDKSSDESLSSADSDCSS